MDQEQKALFRQLQLAGLGLVLVIAGFLMDEPAVPWVGAAVFVYGLVRYFVIRKLLDQTKD